MTIRLEPPDPLLVRPGSVSLDGPWELAADRRGRGVKERWFERTSLPNATTVTVPFCLEAELSGARAQAAVGDFWYLRRFEVPAAYAGREVWLRVGAADHRAEVWVNGQAVGEPHVGGFTPGEWRLDPALVEGENTLSVHVTETRRGRLPRGKQTHLPFPYVIFYEAFSGIWQPVSLEARGRTHVRRRAGVTTADGRGFEFHVALGGAVAASGELELRLVHPDGEADACVTWPLDGLDRATETAAAAATTAEATATDGDRRVLVPITPERAARWSPEAPSLYEVTCTLRIDGEEVDRVESYAGLRRVEVRDGELWLNGEPVYQRLVLYQAYYPGGWATAPDDEAIRADVEAIKSFGFNGVRIHQTIPDPRLLYWCDRLGLLVWEEMPSPFMLSRVDRPAFERLLAETIDRDRGHPSIVARVLFNETWGIFPIQWSERWRRWVREMVARCRALDPTCLVIDNSGYEHLETDILDIHHYLADPEAVRRLYRALADPGRMTYRHWRNLYMLAPSRVHKSPLAPGGRYDGQPVVISECGGHGFGPYAGAEETLGGSLRQVLGLIREHPHIQGFGYTQLCDVANETNGLMTFDRRPKMDPAEVRAIVEGREPT